MKKILIVSLLILQIFSMTAPFLYQVRAVEQTTAVSGKHSTALSGLVVDDKTNQPIENALVKFEGKTASTSATGTFELSGIPVDSIRGYVLGKVTVQKEGYGTWTLKALLYPREDRTLQVRLTQAEQTTEDPLPRAITEQMPDPEAMSRDLGQQSSQGVSSVSIDVNPATINVAITGYANCFDWLKAGSPVIRVDTIDFKEYVKNVLPNEWISSWHPEALKAGAIAAKNYGWRKMNVGARHYLKNMHNLDKYPDIVDNTCDQRYIANTKRASTNAAVDAIWDYRITRNGNLLNNFYLATEAQCLNSPYQPCMPQWGTQYRALEGKTWQQIVEQYYAPVAISLLSVVDVPNGIYRFWSDTFKSHFYTSSTTERDSVIRTYPQSIWRYEGVAYKMVEQETPGAIPVYRFWSDIYRSHFYTTSTEERDYVQSKLSRVWRYEGAVFNVYPNSYTTNTIPVYRFWSDRLSSHFYTASEQEKNYVINTLGSIWTFEGEAWRVPVQ
jgi:hypothetical protein